MEYFIYIITILLPLMNVLHGRLDLGLRKVCNTDIAPTGTRVTTKTFSNNLDCVRECDVNTECNVISYHNDTCILFKDIAVDTCGAIFGGVWEVYKTETACEVGWHRYRGSCYHISTLRLTWSGGELYCNTMGAHLVAVGTPAEGIFLISLLSSLSIADYAVWIGATDDPVEGAWYWVSGEPWSFENWNEGEPNDAIGGEDCSAIIRTSAWNDVACSIEKVAICEKSV